MTKTLLMRFAPSAFFNTSHDISRQVISLPLFTAYPQEPTITLSLVVPTGMLTQHYQ